MRNFYSGLTVVLIIFGFVVPAVWILAIITGLLAICSRPPGLRADGKRRTGGLLGSVWDETVISFKMKTCPFCKETIKKAAMVCRYCHRDLPGTQDKYGSLLNKSTKHTQQQPIIYPRGDGVPFQEKQTFSWKLPVGGVIVGFLLFFILVGVLRRPLEEHGSNEQIKSTAEVQEPRQVTPPLPKQVVAEFVIGRTNLLVEGQSAEVKLVGDSRNLASQLCEPAQQHNMAAKLNAPAVEKMCYPKAWKLWVHDAVKTLLAGDFEEFEKNIGTEAPGEFVLVLPKTSAAVFTSCKPHDCMDYYGKFLVDPKTHELDIIWKSESGYKYFGPQENILRENNIGAWLQEAELNYRLGKTPTTIPSKSTSNPETLVSASPSSTQIEHRSGPQPKRITDDSRFGCVDRQYFEKLIDYAVQKDTQAFYSGLAVGVSSGMCTMFRTGEEVFIADTAIFSGLVKVRRRGEVAEHWTNIEAVR